MLLSLQLKNKRNTRTRTHLNSKGSIDSNTHAHPYRKKKMERDDLVFKAKLAEQAERCGDRRAVLREGGFRKRIDFFFFRPSCGFFLLFVSMVN